MAVKRREVGSIVIVTLKGRFYGDGETDELEKAIMAEASTGNRMLVLNMVECEALNSVGIGVLMRGYANYKGRNGEIKLCGLGHDRFLELVRLTVPVEPTLQGDDDDRAHLPALHGHDE